MLRFQTFPVYKEIRNFVIAIYKLTKLLPSAEKYELVSQLKRAVTSVLLNLAEGSMKKSDKEFRRFLLISIGSVSEVAAILDICLDLNYISSSVYKEYMLKCESIIRY